MGPGQVVKRAPASGSSRRRWAPKLDAPLGLRRAPLALRPFNPRLLPSSVLFGRNRPCPFGCPVHCFPPEPHTPWLDVPIHLQRMALFCVIPTLCSFLFLISHHHVCSHAPLRELYSPVCAVATTGSRCKCIAIAGCWTETQHTLQPLRHTTHPATTAAYIPGLHQQLSSCVISAMLHAIACNPLSDCLHRTTVFFVLLQRVYPPTHVYLVRF